MKVLIKLLTFLICRCLPRNSDIDLATDGFSATIKAIGYRFDIFKSLN